MSFDAQRVLDAIRALELGEIRLMEVCGTHTMAIAKSGLRSMLPENVKLLSGPGCPVCVTPGEVIDAVLELAMRPGLIVTTYGDMVRVPGSTPGDNLARRRALGARVEVVYSPVDAVTIARENPDKEIVFLGVGFETTAPGTAAAVLTAKEKGVKNFSLFSMLKTVEPALRALIASEGFKASMSRAFSAPATWPRSSAKKASNFSRATTRCPPSSAASSRRISSRRCICSAGSSPRGKASCRTNTAAPSRRRAIRWRAR